tara:strand:+ start:31 stop:489 length:459 start_codon:yes stop_codon:yes gene_type:complete
MKKYTNILLLVGSILVFSCEDDEGSGSDYSVNADYVGNWTRTYFAQYDGDACSGTPEYVDTVSTMTYALNDDGTVSITGIFCNETNATDEMCQSTWGASGTTIRIGSSPFHTEFVVEDVNEGLTMTSKVQVEIGSSLDDLSPACQETIYTKQ